MNPLIFAVVVLSVGAIAVTVYAVLSAIEGFEDESGFHAIRPRQVPKKIRECEGTATSKNEPLVSAH